MIRIYVTCDAPGCEIKRQIGEPKCWQTGIHYTLPPQWIQELNWVWCSKQCRIAGHEREGLDEEGKRKRR